MEEYEWICLSPALPLRITFTGKTLPPPPKKKKKKLISAHKTKQNMCSPSVCKPHPKNSWKIKKLKMATTIKTQVLRTKVSFEQRVRFLFFLVRTSFFVKNRPKVSEWVKMAFFFFSRSGGKKKYFFHFFFKHFYIFFFENNFHFHQLDNQIWRMKSSMTNIEQGQCITQMNTRQLEFNIENLVYRSLISVQKEKYFQQPNQQKRKGRKQRWKNNKWPR